MIFTFLFIVSFVTFHYWATDVIKHNTTLLQNLFDLALNTTQLRPLGDNWNEEYRMWSDQKRRHIQYSQATTEEHTQCVISIQIIFFGKIAHTDAIQFELCFHRFSVGFNFTITNSLWKVSFDWIYDCTVSTLKKKKKSFFAIIWWTNIAKDNNINNRFLKHDRQSLELRGFLFCLTWKV